MQRKTESTTQANHRDGRKPLPAMPEVSKAGTIWEIKNEDHHLVKIDLFWLIDLARLISNGRFFGDTIVNAFSLYSPAGGLLIYRGVGGSRDLHHICSVRPLNKHAVEFELRDYMFAGGQRIAGRMRPMGQIIPTSHTLLRATTEELNRFYLRELYLAQPSTPQ